MNSTCFVPLGSFGPYYVVLHVFDVFQNQWNNWDLNLECEEGIGAVSEQFGKQSTIWSITLHSEVQMMQVPCSEARLTQAWCCWKANPIIYNIGEELKPKISVIQPQ
ncbi:hypothetical protein LINGRAHAP2_LOCUS2571 [Linum grandiflorum]